MRNKLLKKWAELIGKAGGLWGRFDCEVEPAPEAYWITGSLTDETNCFIRNGGQWGGKIINTYCVLCPRQLYFIVMIQILIVSKFYVQLL